MGINLEFNDIAVIIVGIISMIYLTLKWKYSYWHRLGLKNPKPTLLVGNTYDIFAQKISFGEKVAEMYNEMKSAGQKHFGIYFLTAPMYVPVDPEIIKLVMQKDFHHFMDRGIYFNEETDPLSAHLFAIEGQKWKNLRVKLTPTFTSSKMKMMFSTVVAATKDLTSLLKDTRPDDPLEIKDVLARLTTDVIGSCAFGIECNSLKDPDAEFRKYGKKVFNDEFWKNIGGLLTFVWPNFMRYFKYNLTDGEVSKFFMNAVKDTVEYREKTNFYRKDFMQLLIELKNKGTIHEDAESETGSDAKRNGKANDTITFNEVAAQAFIFFLGGFETSSTTMSFCLYELCLHQEIQQKLRNEIEEVLSKFDGNLCYDALADLRYMDMVVEETMRKYPTLPVLNRICTKDYTIPEFGVTLRRGTKVLIPVGAIHHDPEHYPNPDSFDPERFTEANKSKRDRYTYIPFGEGPRICIGLRFGMMQVKVGLSVLLKNYRFTLNHKTPVPLKMDPANFLNSPLGGIWMNIEKINS